MTLLMRLRVGSHLYGTARPDSDEDWYEVHDHLPGTRRVTQNITGDQDIIRVGLSTFMRLANDGIPQNLEVMFAPPHMADVDLIRDMRNGYRAGASAVVTLTRTIDAFNKLKPTVKRRRHAVRLNYCRDQIINHGRFDPTDTSWLLQLAAELRFPTDPRQ